MAAETGMVLAPLQLSLHLALLQDRSVQEVTSYCREEQGAGFHVCIFPAEFRSRQMPAGAGSSSLFLPLESAGPPAPFPSDPGPGVNPSIPLGALQAGEAMGQRSRCQEWVFMSLMLSWDLGGFRVCGQAFLVHVLGVCHADQTR